MGDTAVSAVARVGRFTVARVVMDEGTLGIWSTEAEMRAGSSSPAETAAGTEAIRVEAGAETLSEAAVSGAGAAVTAGDIEAGAETVETGGEVADKVGQEGEAIPVKDSDLWNPSPSLSVLGD